MKVDLRQFTFRLLGVNELFLQNWDIKEIFMTSGAERFILQFFVKQITSNFFVWICQKIFFLNFSNTRCLYECPLFSGTHIFVTSRRACVYLNIIRDHSLCMDTCQFLFCILGQILANWRNYSPNSTINISNYSKFLWTAGTSFFFKEWPFSTTTNVFLN